jgi:hypothetical protein
MAVAAIAWSGTLTAAHSTTSVGPSQKAALCHATANGYIEIEVARKAVPAHQAHGDAAVGAEVPGQAGMVFNPDCLPVPAAIGGPLVCGAPGGGSNPGGTTPPGPYLITTSGAQVVEITVAASPAPPDGTRLLQELYLNGRAMGAFNLPLVGGVYSGPQGVGWSTMSGVLEFRFTLSSNQCSLYWNLNPTDAE